MSAEPTEPKRDVAGHPRRRRGKRRGGRRREGSDGAAVTGPVAVDTTDTLSRPASTDAEAADRPQSQASSGGSRRGRRGRRRKPSRPTTDAPEGVVAGTRSADGRPVDSEATVVVKPSDLSAAVRPSGRAPRSGAQAGRAATDNGATPRLRTVRETSAGGLVVSGIDEPGSERCAALIGRVDRRGRMMWSLPKGHIETGETAEQTAMREVAEETGIEGNVVASLGKIDYWFVSEGKRIHKTVHHYLMRSTGGELSDADYEVAEVAWVPLADLPKRLTYSDERRLARAAADVIDELSHDPELLARSEADNVRTEPNDYEKAAAARNQRRNEPVRAARPRRRRRGPRRGPGGDAGAVDAAPSVAGSEPVRRPDEPRNDG